MCLASLVLAALACAPAAGAELHHFDDAALHAVYFHDQREGWVVGDEGVIWHTIDGGQNWERQPSGVRASLRSVFFHDPYNGWAVGREELTHGGSAGVVLHTSDGGLKWRRILVNALPGLNVVRFTQSGSKTGYLCGDGSEQYPTGVFVTDDGGRSWQPVPGPRCPSWLAADFLPDGGALAGAWNRQATVRRGKLFAVDTDLLGGRNLRGVQLRGDGGVAVGQGGLVLLSEGTRGSSWVAARLGLPRDVLADWDFHAVHGVGPDVWAVGRPGSAALHSRDSGRTWEVVRLGQPLPLNGLYFRDPQHGWAVGELGTVIATCDGGKSWRVQRRGGLRAATLFVHARLESVPADTLALLGGQEGYLTAAVRVVAPDPSTAAPAKAAEPARLAQAVRQAGGAGAEQLWQFPLSSHLAASGRLEAVAAWDRLHDGRAADHLLRQLVLALRIWRPDVIVTDHAEAAATGNGSDTVVAEAMREAFRRAADPTAYAGQLRVLGLEACKPLKLYGLCNPAKGASVVYDLTALSPRLGSTLAEFASGPAAQLVCAPVELPADRGFLLLADFLPDAPGHRDLMQGTALAPGGVARRGLPQVEGPAAAMVKAVRQRANLQALARTPAEKIASPERLLAQIGPMLADMPEDQAAPAAFAVAAAYARAGQWTLAREAYLLLVDRYPTHPLARDAYRWLVAYTSSSEARRRHEMGEFLVVEHLDYGQRVEGKAPAKGDVPLPKGFDDEPKGKENKNAKDAKSGKDAKSAKDPKAKPKKEAKPFEAPRFETQSSREAVGPSHERARQWYKGSLDLEPRLAALGPLFVRDPAVQFCLQSARRTLGDWEPARKWYADFAAKQPDGPWRSAALAELWLANRTGPPPKPVLTCRRTQEKPYLDGKFDDPCWHGAEVARLTSAGDLLGRNPAAEKRPRPADADDAGRDPLAEYPTEVRTAHDKEFLYLAIRCGHPADQAVGAAAVRTRDGDLRQYDRVSVVLDLDRDYATYFHFQIDQRGCVAEDCWGDRKWSPRWYVATRREKGAWLIEAAIPLSALSADGVTAGQAWAFNVIRVLPGRGVLAWSQPAEAPEEALRTEGLGLMLFTQEARRAAADTSR
jgi:photosystem II stability/assembly factor-like uncharacterized protein